MTEVYRYSDIGDGRLEPQSSGDNEAATQESLAATAIADVAKTPSEPNALYARVLQASNWAGEGYEGGTK